MIGRDNFWTISKSNRDVVGTGKLGETAIPKGRLRITNTNSFTFPSYLLQIVISELFVLLMLLLLVVVVIVVIVVC